MNFTFEQPLWLLASLLALPVVYLSLRQARIRVAGSQFRKTGTASRVVSHVPRALVVLGLILGAVALAKPVVAVNDKTAAKMQGRDIILALDWSASMGEPYKGERTVRKVKPWWVEEGVEVNPAAERTGEPADGAEGAAQELRRIDAAQDAILRFAETRQDAESGDHVALIIFDWRPLLRWPLDRDIKQIVRHGSFLPQGEGPQGLGVGTNFGGENPGPIDLAAEHFVKKGTSTTRVLVLVTDGENEIKPEAKARLVKLLNENGIRLYVIGIGEKIGKGELDLERLTREQGGEVFRAENQAELDQCFAKINALESSPVPVLTRKSFEPIFAGFLIASMLLAVVGFVFEALILGR